MSFLIGVLTFFLILNCLVLILLVLVQLPKKDAGAGIAFGGGTADALFGAGSGNVLTKITKYATGILLVLALIIGYLQDKAHHGASGSSFEKLVEQQSKKSAATAPGQAAPPSPSVPVTPPSAPASTTAPVPAAPESAK
jgi:preprotein translocase subunit SecG